MSTEPIEPEHIKYDNENITWDEIEDASSYQVIINDETYTLYDNTFDVSYLDDGTYDIIIFAIYDDDKQASSHFAFTITREYEAPTNLRFSHPILSFDSQRPTSYELYIDNELITTFDSTTIDISSYIEDNQVYEIKIHAIYNDEYYISDVFILDTHNKLDLDKELTYILKSSTELIFTFDELEEVSYILYDDEIFRCRII